MIRPLSDHDIYRAADALVKQYGEGAPLEAAMRADKMLAKGDMEGKAVWLRILKAVDDLLKTNPGSNERKH